MDIELLVLLAMLGVFLIGNLLLKLPVSISMILGAVAGALVAGEGIPIRHLFEGCFTYVDTILIISTAMLFMTAIQRSGALEALNALIVTKFYKVPALMLILLNLFLFLVGMIVNDATGMLLCAPILLPLAESLGIGAVQFSAVMGVNLAMGGVTPPYASILYLGMRVGNCQFNEILKPTLIFLLCGYVPVVFLTTFWAPLSTWLPGIMGLLG